jgi:hypothetical protein
MVVAVEIFLFSLEPKVRDAKARGVVTHDAFDILRETFGGLSVDVERQRHRSAADAVQFTKDGLGNVADLRRRAIGIKRNLSVEAPRSLRHGQG